MKSALTLALIFALTLSAPAAFAKPKTVPVDTAQSQVQWVGKKVTGQHNGTVALKSGQIELDGRSLKGGKFEIDMTSIKVEDVKDADSNGKLTGHLKSDDFFGVDKNPVSTFVITSVKPLGAKKDAAGNTHEITGNLTIKGATHPVTFPAKIEIAKDQAKAAGKLVIDRTKFDIKYRSGKFFPELGDKLIHDNFEIDLNLSAKI